MDGKSQTIQPSCQRPGEQLQETILQGHVTQGYDWTWEGDKWNCNGNVKHNDCEQRVLQNENGYHPWLDHESKLLLVATRNKIQKGPASLRSI